MTESLTADAFETTLAEYVYERSEEGRAVRVGEKETSEQAAIVARYAALFSRETLAELAADRDSADGDARERLARLHEACLGGLLAKELADASDALENAILATELELDGESMSLRTGQAQLAVRDDYAERAALGVLVAEASATHNDARLDLLERAESLEADLTGQRDPIARSAELKQIDLRELSTAVSDASRAVQDAYRTRSERHLDALLGDGREAEPSSAHVPYVRRLSPLADTYSKERAVGVCLDSLAALGFDLAGEARIKLDLEDRPQKNPRACVIASRPPDVVHLITRAQGGLADYEAFLHEAGHALHYAGCDAALPYTFRRLARDHALTEIYAFFVESVTREPEWHMRHFGLDEEAARRHTDMAFVIETLLFRRYAAKLESELVFWSDLGNAREHGPVYSDLVSAASGFRYPASAYLADMDGGFYTADYLRAWVRAAQVRAALRSEVGESWWRDVATGDLLRDLFREGTRPSNEDVAARLGFDALDTGPLVAELSELL